MPGELRGLEYIHHHYGSLPWSDLLRPAIKLARDGFEVSDDFAAAMDFAESDAGCAFLSADPVWAIDFAPNGTRVGKGDWITRKRLARTLERVAQEGVDVFYIGSMAEDTIQTIRENNGSLMMEDLQNYEVVSRKPVEIEYKGFRILACGAPASGSVTLSMLKILEGYTESKNETENLSTHRMIEAIRFGYGKVSTQLHPS